MGSFAALCIPTYKRSECVKEFLNEYSSYYIKNNIDIYYYDSSPDDETEKAVSSHSEYNKHVFLVKMPEEIHSNVKAYRIFQKYGLKKEYDYLWLSNDALRYSEKVISDIRYNADYGYDIIELDANDVENLGTKVYNDKGQFLCDCAWKLTLYGSALLNTKKMLCEVDWDYLTKKYIRDDRINFSHVGFYFEQLYKNKTFSALHLSVDGKEFKSSTLKKKMGWYNQIFFILCESWVNVIKALPDEYSQKNEAIVKHGKYALLKNEEAFIKLRLDGVFGEEEYLKYEKQWEKVCCVPIEKIKEIAYTPISLIENTVNSSRDEVIGRFMDFIKSYDSLIIYGAGNMAYIFASFCIKSDIDFSFFCVSESNKPTVILGHEVKEFQTVKNELKNTGIIICMKENLAKEVSDFLDSEKIDSYYYDCELLNVAGEILGYNI